VPYTLAVFLLVTALGSSGIKLGREREIVWLLIALTFVTSMLAVVWLLFVLAWVFRSQAAEIEVRTKIMGLCAITALLWWAFL
jgi:hypothetical protein